MVATYALYMIIFHLERILPDEKFRFIKECVNTRVWGMGDLCFTCKKPFKTILNLRLPKKTSLYNIYTVRESISRAWFFDKTDTRECHLPLCKKCIHKVYGILSEGWINSLLDLICAMNGEKTWHYHRLKYGAVSREIWDPVKKYDQLVGKGKGFKIDDVTRVTNGTVYLNVSDGIVHLPSIIAGLYPSIIKTINEFGYKVSLPPRIYQKSNFFERDMVIPYRSVNYP